jgi:hypothetical protein
MTQQAITATGLKGFLQWLKQDQPGIYAATAGQIAKAVPKGFSGFNGSALTAARLRVGRRSMALRGYGSLGCCGTSEPTLSQVGTCAAMANPSINFSCVGSCSVETSCAANSGATCSSALTGVANIINSVAGAALSASQANAYNNLVQTQLSRASTGLPPLQLSSSAAGLPTIGGLSSSTSALVWVAGGAALLYLLFGRK